MIYYSDERCALLQGDCLEMMAKLPDQCAHAIIADPPYGTTACKWDSVIPFEPMWEQLKRIIKPNGAIVLFGSEPFSSLLRCSNLKMYKYDWVWDKKRGSNFMSTKMQPMKEHENIIIFSKERHVYNPIKIIRTSNRHKRSYAFETPLSEVYGGIKSSNKRNLSDMREPKSILEFAMEVNNQYKKNRFHPTQKPVALLEYLIKTYTNEGEIVLDFTMGSGTTGVACMKTGRKFIGIERDEKYFQIAKERIINENNH